MRPNFSISSLLLVMLLVAVFFVGVEYCQEQLLRSLREEERAQELKMHEIVRRLRESQLSR